MEGVASEYAQEPAQAPPERTIVPDGIYGVFRAGRIEAAALREIGRYGCLIKPDAQDQHIFQDFHGHHFFVKRPANSRHIS